MDNVNWNNIFLTRKNNQTIPGNKKLTFIIAKKKKKKKIKNS